MIFFALLVASFVPVSVLAGTPGALKSISGRDYSHHLKRTDEPFPFRLALAKRGASAVPRTLQVPATPARRSSPAGAVVAARQISCDPGYSACTDGNGCCPTGADCCTEVAQCCSGGTCCGASCCDNNGVCCGAAGCCDSGHTCQTVSGFTGCCAAGQQCDGFTGCSDPSLVECADFPFCCPSGETCGRDSSGNATCNGQDTAQDATSSAGVQTPTQGDTSVTSPGAASTTSSSSSTGSSQGTGSVTSRPITTGTGTTSAPSSTGTATTGAAAGLAASNGPLAVVGFLATLILFA